MGTCPWPGYLIAHPGTRGIRLAAQPSKELPHVGRQRIGHLHGRNVASAVEFTLPRRRPAIRTGQPCVISSGIAFGSLIGRGGNGSAAYLMPSSRVAFPE